MHLTLIWISLDVQRLTCKVALKFEFDRVLFYTITKNISTHSSQTLDLSFRCMSFCSKRHCKADILLTNPFIMLMSSSLEWSMLLSSMNSRWILIAARKAAYDKSGLTNRGKNLGKSADDTFVTLSISYLFCIPLARTVVMTGENSDNFTNNEMSLTAWKHKQTLQKLSLFESKHFVSFIHFALRFSSVRFFSIVVNILQYKIIEDGEFSIVIPSKSSKSITNFWRLLAGLLSWCSTLNLWESMFTFKVKIS